MSLTAQLDRLIVQAFEDAGFDAKNARAVRSQRADLADYQSNGAMAAAKLAGKPPRIIAEDVAERLKVHADLFSEVSVAGPGFINLRLTDSWLGKEAGALLDDPHQDYDPACHKTRRVVIDFSGPNIAKEMHAGHLRSTILGESLQRILRFSGDTVISDAHFGDWGTPMGMIIAELQHEQPGLPYFDPAITDGYPAEPPIDIEALSELYRRASTRNKESEDAKRAAREATLDLQNKRPGYLALWEHFRTVTFQAVRRNYDRLGVGFDLWLGESDTADLQREIVEELRGNGIATESQGALVIHLDADKAKPPLILEKSDGGYMYGTFDLATILDRVRTLKPDVIVYVVDVRQAQHFTQVFKAAEIAGYAQGVAFVHAANGTINGADGKPFKTRAGGVMRLEDVLDLGHAKAMEELPPASDAGLSEDELSKLAEQISVAAIKFQDLKNNRASDYIFDVDSFTKFEGKTGPYLQYAVVRCNAILAKAGNSLSPMGEGRGPSEALAKDGKGEGIIESPSPALRAPSPIGERVLITNPAERVLALELLAFPTALQAAVANFEPSIIADHAFTVAQAYSSFYANSPVLNEPDAAIRASRLRLVAIVKQHLTLCLDLLGIEAPEMMPNRKSVQVDATSFGPRQDGNIYPPQP
jgi:arginyl-tRNA synthetase